MSVAQLATVLDIEMLSSVGLAPLPSYVPTSALPEYTGEQVAMRTGYRYLLRYVRPHQIGDFLEGSNREHFVCPTPYAVEDTVTFLTLPNPMLPPRHALLLDTAALGRIRGPRMVRLGLGVELVLPAGFTRDAIVAPGWERELR